MNKLITLLIFVFVFGKIQAQTQWNTVTNLSNPSNTSYGHFLNVIDSATVILTPKYTFDTPDIKKTTDGGLTWTSYTIDTTLYTILHEVEFTDKNMGYIVRGTGFGNWNVFQKTTDGGQNWQSVNLPFLENTSFYSITEASFVTDQIGFIARSGENKIYRTTNGGLNFNALNLPTIPNNINTFLSEMSFISPYVGFVIRILTSDHVSSATEILKTTDGGITWTIVSTTIEQNLDVWEKKDKIQFVNNLQGFALVGTGNLKTTQDGGNTWLEQTLPLAIPAPTDFYFVNNACGYIALAGNIYRTDDAGNSWTVQTIENNLNAVKYIQFANENFGYGLNNSYTAPNNQINETLLNTHQKAGGALSLTKFQEDDAFSIYPNPATDVIHIQNKNNVEVNFIHLLDTSGKIIKTFNDNFEHLDVSSISAGNYLLYIQTTKHKAVKKVIIK